MGQAISAILAYGGAPGLLTKGKLWRYALVPILLSVALLVAIVAAAWGWSDDLGAWLVSAYPWDWGRSWVEGFAHVFSAIAIVALGLLVYKNAVLALCSPFMSFLSEKLEEQLRGEASSAKFTLSGALHDLMRGIRLSLRNLIRELLLTIVLLALGLIPLFTPFAPFAIFGVQSYYAGYGNMDYTMERHFPLRETVSFVRKNRGLALGNGIVFMGLLLTVVGFLIALPLATVAATKETVKLLPERGQPAA